MLELRQLRSLLAIAETGSITQAAQRLHLTQSALSHQIRALEQFYDLPLLERRRQGLVLTAAGQQLLALAQDVLPRVDATERTLRQWKEGARGELRIALECHTCFDWLMPVLDQFRPRWPEVELDLVAGFHAEPWSLLLNGKADVVIGAAPPSPIAGVVSVPLFRFEILLVMHTAHALRQHRHIMPSDLVGETLLTYPVPDARIDVIREFLTPASVTLPRRTAELTIALLQLVASRRGVAALPNWGVKSYVEHDYVVARPLGKKGLWSSLFASMPTALATRHFVNDFVEIVRRNAVLTLEGVEVL